MGTHFKDLSGRKNDSLPGSRQGWYMSFCKACNQNTVHITCFHGCAACHDKRLLEKAEKGTPRVDKN